MNVRHINLVGPVGSVADQVFEGLQALGCAVRRFDHRKGEAPGAAAAEADLTLVIRGEGIAPDLIRQFPRPTVLWHAEIIHPAPELAMVDEVSRARAALLQQNVSAFDFVFHHDFTALETIRRLGGRSVHWAGFGGIQPTLHRKLDVPKRYDVGFAGAGSARRRQAVQHLQRAGIDVACKQVYGEDYNCFVNECKVFLNVHFSEVPNTEYRLLETLGAGTLAITETITMPDLYRDCEHLVEYRQGELDDLLRKVRYYLDHEDEREEIASCGHDLVHRHFTVIQQCRALLDVVDYRWTLGQAPAEEESFRHVYRPSGYGSLDGAVIRFASSQPKPADNMTPVMAQQTAPAHGQALVHDHAQEIEKGEDLLRKGLHRQALTLFEGILQENAENTAALNNAALALNELGDAKRATQHLERALAADPANEIAFYNLLTLLQGVEGVAAAVKAYQTYEQGIPDSEEKLRHLKHLKQHAISQAGTDTAVQSSATKARSVMSKPTFAHFYQTIPGWFNFQQLYRLVVEKLPNGSRFVEVGAWLGCSTAFLATEILNSGKEITLFAVDTWEGSLDESYHQEVVQQHGGSIYTTFLHNMARGGVLDVIRPIRLDSIQASRLFEDRSLDFVFIDAQHTYEAVRLDIDSWYPKVKPGGILAGHDYHANGPGVIQAVDESFGSDKIIMLTSWVHVKTTDRTKELAIEPVLTV